MRLAPLAPLAAALLFASVANAGPLRHSLVPGADDGRTTLDPSTGLEWLDLTETLGHSVRGVLSGAGIDPNAGTGWVPSGWRYATRSEVCGLFEPQVGPMAGCGAAGAQSPAGIGLLQGLLGVTDAQPGPGAGFRYSRGYYGAGEGLVTLLTFDGAATAELGSADGAGDPGTGHYLVRAAQVPEGSAAPALLASLAAWTARRRVRG